MNDRESRLQVLARLSGMTLAEKLHRLVLEKVAQKSALDENAAPVDTRADGIAAFQAWVRLRTEPLRDLPQFYFPSGARFYDEFFEETGIFLSKRARRDAMVGLTDIPQLRMGGRRAETSQ